jgi:hypothetical protein
MNQTDFIQKRAEAHAAACQGVAGDAVVQMALAMRTADIEVKAAMAVRAIARAHKSDQIQVTVVAESVAVKSVFRRQAG